MRLRNVKNKEEIMNNSTYLLKDYKNYLGNFHKLFKNNNPIELEIGCGKGRFIINKALSNPNINYIGIEKYDSVVARCLEKIPEGINNLIIIRMNANELNEVFSKEIDTIYLNFSDPWPKKRWRDRRLTSKVFLEKYDFVFKNSPHIIQKTDNKDLFAYSIVSLSTYGYKIIAISFDLHNSDIENNIETEFEIKYSENGKNIYYLEAIK